MGKNINKCTFEGNIGQDLSLKFMPNGTAVLNFSIACANDYKDKQSGEWVNQTDWLDCVAFGKTAEFIDKACSKGSSILISNARYRKRPWDGKDGKKNYASEFVINDWELLDSKQSNQQSAPVQNNPAVDDFDNSDIPF